MLLSCVCVGRRGNGGKPMAASHHLDLNLLAHFFGARLIKNMENSDVLMTYGLRIVLLPREFEFLSLQQIHFRN